MLKGYIKKLCTPFDLFQAYRLSRQVRRNKKNGKMHIGLVCEEFFHKDLRGFGGFGKTVKNISDHYNVTGGPFEFSVLLSQSLPLSKTPQIRRFHNAEVLLRPHGEHDITVNFLNYARLIHDLKTELFLTIDYYPTYEKFLRASPTTPVVIWIRDPRSKDEWGKLATVSLEIKQRGKKNGDHLTMLAEEKAGSLKRILQFSKIFRRKVIFATNGYFLVERAKKTYGLPDLKPYLLLNPIPLPSFNGVHYSPKPSLCFLGRLDAQKRFWVVLELAKRFPGVDFLIAGDTHAPELMQPVIDRYSSLKNTQFLGLVDGQKKDKLLENCWGLINTSIHEGLPVSFLEAFSYGKCVISCQNPEGLVEKYGYYTGEILGEGMDENVLATFSRAINDFLTRESDRIEKGRQARKYIEENHSFAVFENRFKEILSSEGILS